MQEQLRGGKQFFLWAAVFFAISLFVVVGFITVRMYHANKQRNAIEAIVKLEGMTRYHLAVDDLGNPLPDPESSESSWLRRMFGNDFFDDVVFAELWTDEQLKYVNEFPQMRRLRLHRQPVCRGDGWAVATSGVPMCRVTTSGVSNIRGLDQLRELDLTYVRLTDEQLVEVIRGLKRIEKIVYCMSKITDAGLQELVVPEYLHLPRQRWGGTMRAVE